MTLRRGEHRVRQAIVAALVVVGTIVVGATLKGCGDDEECLVWGENCSLEYKQNNYGRTDIQCCSGQCSDHGSGVVTCGS